MKTLKDFNFKNKRVLVRAGYNVPVDEKGNITDSTKIEDSLPTIKYLLANDAKIILMSHLGRPDGEVKDIFKLDKVALKLFEFLNKKVVKLNDCIGPEVENAISEMKAKDIILLENLRFYKEEEANDSEFKKKLASLGDIYVNESFSDSHRRHASLMLPELIPGCAGLSLEKELKYLSLDKAKKPIVVIMGGVKLETKLPVIEKMLNKADKLLLGGAMIYTFYKAKGFGIGSSLHEDSYLKEAKKIMINRKLMLPVDTLLLDKKTVDVDKIPETGVGMDVGQKTIGLFKKEIERAKTIIWNGPMGKFEENEFSIGTEQIAKSVAGSTAVKIAGGGDTIVAIKKFKLEKKFSHISTGGGAMLEFLAGKEMPGLDVLSK